MNAISSNPSARCQALLALFLTLAAACSGATRTSAESTSADRAALDTDEDGVQRLLPSAAKGAWFRLGNRDPNSADGLAIERRTPATAGRDSKPDYWTIAAHTLDYSSGGSGKTARLHIHASGGEQYFTWQNQRGYLGNARDLRNQEFTAYVRVRGVFDAHRAAVSLKIRGGAHTSRDGDLASCTMLTFAPAGERVTRFGKELRHPEYDYVPLEPRFAASLEDGLWVGLKLVSYSVRGTPASVMNRLYVDTEPFDRHVRPRNGWRLFSEYLDVEGKSTGKYATLVDWGGHQTTVRSDGVDELDVAILSVREIEPPMRDWQMP